VRSCAVRAGTPQAFYLKGFFSMSPSQVTLTQKRILVSKYHGTPVPLFPTSGLVLTSAKTSWSGLLVEEHHLPPAEFPERTASTHQITVHLRPATLVWLLGGHPRTVRVTPGSVNIIPQGTILGGYGKDETQFIMLSLDPSFVERIARDSGAVTPVELIKNLETRDPQIAHIAEALRAELETGCPSGRLYGDSMAVALAAHLLGKFEAHSPLSLHHGGLPAYKLRRVTEYITDNLGEDLVLAKIADVAELNPYYFCRAFKQSTGVTLHRYVINCRIERAKTLLAEKRVPLVEVAMGAGFQTQSHFTTLFHKLTGVTPKAYRDGLSTISAPLDTVDEEPRLVTRSKQRLNHRQSQKRVKIVK